MDSVLKFIVDMKIVDFAILGMGIFGLALIAERVKSLYFTYSMNAKAFMEHVF